MSLESRTEGEERSKEEDQSDDAAREAKDER